MASNTTIKVTIDAKGVVTGVDQVAKSMASISKQATATQASIAKAVTVDFKAQISGLKDYSQQIQKTANVASNLQSALVGYFSFQAITGGIKSAIGASVELQNALKGVTSVAQAFGQDSGAVKDAIKSFTSDGLIGATDAALAFKQVLSTGTDLPTAIKLLNSLKDTAAFNRQAFYSLGEAVVATTEGIKNGNSVRADAVGVTKNLSVLEKEYAASINKTVAQLTDQEKMQARVTGFIREGAFAAGDATTLLASYSGAISQLDAAQTRYLATLGDAITTSSAVTGVIQELSSLISDLEKQQAQANGASFIDKIVETGLLALDMIYRVQNAIFSGIMAGLKGATAIVLNLMAKVEDAFNYIIRVTNKLTGAEIGQGGIFGKASQDALKDFKKEYASFENSFKGSTLYSTLAGGIEKNRAAATLGTKAKSPFQNLVTDQAASLKAQAELNKQQKKLLKEQNTIIRDSLNDMVELQRKAQASLKEGANQPLVALIFGTDTTRQLQATRAELQKLSDQFGGKNADVNAKLAENDKLISTSKRNGKLGAAAGIGNAIAGGKEGARSLIVEGAGLALDTIAPGLGQAAKPLIDALTQGPAAVKTLVQDFAKALPEIIVAFVTAIPVFVEEIIKQIPVIIQRLADAAPAVIESLTEKAPDIIIALVEAIPQVIEALISNLPKIVIALQLMMPKIALKLIGEIVKNVPRIIGEFISQLGKGLSKILNKLTGGLIGDDGKKDSGGVKGFAQSGPTSNKDVNVALNVVTLGASGAAKKTYDWAKKTFGFSKGGEINAVRGGLSMRDSVPARLMSGELVVDKGTTRKLKKALDDGGGVGKSGNDEALRRILALLEKPMQVETAVKLNQNEFAKIILNLNRTGQRVNA